MNADNQWQAIGNFVLIVPCGIEIYEPENRQSTTRNRLNRTMWN